MLNTFHVVVKSEFTYIRSFSLHVTKEGNICFSDSHPVTQYVKFSLRKNPVRFWSSSATWDFQHLLREIHEICGRKRGSRISSLSSPL